MSEPSCKLLTVTLLTARDIRAIAADIGLRPTKQKGQNFVIDPNTVRSIVAAARLDGPQNVVEIGPGLGSLTLGLLEAGHEVTAVEIDEVLATRLPDTIARFAPDATARFDLVGADALRVNSLPKTPQALVANLPYNVAVPVLLHFLEIFPSLRTVLVMVQLEVAERLAAAPGSRTYGVPSVKAQWYGNVSLAGRIGKNVFWPAPNIDSGLVRIDITRHDPAEARAAGSGAATGAGSGSTGPTAETETESAAKAQTGPAVAPKTPSGGADPVARVRLFTLVDAAFAQRRKTLRAALAGWAGSAHAAEVLLLAAGIDPKTRGEALSMSDFERLAAVRAEGKDAVPGEDAVSKENSASSGNTAPAVNQNPVPNREPASDKDTA